MSRLRLPHRRWKARPTRTSCGRRIDRAGSLCHRNVSHGGHRAREVCWSRPAHRSLRGDATPCRFAAWLGRASGPSQRGTASPNASRASVVNSVHCRSSRSSSAVPFARPARSTSSTNASACLRPPYSSFTGAAGDRAHQYLQRQRKPRALSSTSSSRSRLRDDAARRVLLAAISHHSDEAHSHRC